jgi:predicted  nucleic acid-binding Zn-ribbon protein
MASPIPFIQPDDNGQFYIDKKAMKILQNVKGAVSVICVAGPYRTGKSYLLNRLIYDENKQESNEVQPNGFQVGNTVNACTKGIWLWSEPYYNPTTNTTYLFLDTEGLNSTGEEATFDTQIFSLSVLLASVFILNTTSSITESDLEQLELVAECSKKISFENIDDGDDDDHVETQLALHFPRLIWVLRDFSLNLVDKDNSKITPNQYLENILQPLSSTKKGTVEKNRIRKCIRDCFLKRECFPLPRPVNDENDLQKLQHIPFDKLRPEFTNGMRTLKMRSLQLYNHFRSPLQASPNAQNTETRKYIKGKPVTGDVLLGMTQIYVDAINNGEVPTILSAWQSVLETKKLSLGQEYVSDVEDYLWSLVEPSQSAQKSATGRRGSLKGQNSMNDGQQQQQQQPQEPELDTNVITEKYDLKLQSLFKSLSAQFPGDNDSITMVQNLVATKTEPVLQKVCAFANMHAAEYNKKLLKSILNQTHPQLKIPNEAVFDQLAHWDPQSGVKPANNAAATAQHIQNIVEQFQDKAKGADKGAGIERELLFTLSKKANNATFSTIVTVGTQHLELQQKEQRLVQDLDMAKKEVQQARALADRYNTQIADLQTSLNNLRDERERIVSKLREDLMELKSTSQLEKNQLTLKCDQLDTKLSTTTDALQQLHLDKKNLQDKVKNLQTSLESTNNNHTNTQNKFVQADTENKNLVKRLGEVNANITQLEIEYKQLAKTAQHSAEKLKEREGEVMSLNDMLANTRSLQKSTKTENNQLSDQVENYRQQLAAAEKALAQHGDANAMVDTIQNEMKKVQRSNEQLQKENQSLQSTTEFLTKKVTHLEQDLSDLQHAKLTQGLLSATKRPSMDYNGHQNKKQRTSYVSDDEYQFQDAVGHFDQDGDFDEEPQNDPKALVKLGRGGKKSKGGKTHMETLSDDDDDTELNRVAQKEARRRSTISRMDLKHDADDDDDDEDSDVPKAKTPKKGQSGWSNPLDFSPAKVPDQAKILERRKRDGSIFAGNGDSDEESDEEIQPVAKTTKKAVAAKVTKPAATKATKSASRGGVTSAFKAAAKASYQDDDEAEYRRLKVLQNKNSNKMGDDDDDVDDDSEEEVQVPPGAPENYSSHHFPSTIQSPTLLIRAV